MINAAQRRVFAQENVSDILSRWDDLAVSLAERFPKAAELMNEVREDVLAFRHFPPQHWKKVWSTNLLERLNVAPAGALSAADHKAPHPRLRHLPQRRGDHPPGWGGAVTPGQHRRLSLTTQLRSDERLDKSIVLFHRGETRDICTSRMSARHSSLITL